jgi:TfoX/Sxy family transcriptional regulator of competence genes
MNGYVSDNYYANQAIDFYRTERSKIKEVLRSGSSSEYYEYVMECLNKAGEVTSRKMMGEYCLYFDGKLFGDICDNRLLVKQTETSKRLLADCPLEYPYEGSKTLMFLVSEFENPELMKELLEGMYKELK